MSDTQKPTNYRRGIAYAKENREAAAIILAEVERYGGESGAMVKWAQIQVDRNANS